MRVADRLACRHIGRVRLFWHGHLIVRLGRALLPAVAADQVGRQADDRDPTGATLLVAIVDEAEVGEGVHTCKFGSTLRIDMDTGAAATQYFVRPWTTSPKASAA